MKHVNGGLPNKFRVTLSNKDPIHFSGSGKKVHLPPRNISTFHSNLPPRWNEYEDKSIIIPTLNKNGRFVYKDKTLYYEDSDKGIFIVSLDSSSTEKLAKKARQDLKDLSITSQQFFPPPDEEV